MFQNSDQFLYLTSAPFYDCGFVLGQRYIMTIYIYIYIYIYRIGHFADKLRPEPMHCEINAWQHYIDLLYLEAVRIKKFDPFVSALAAPIGNRDGDVKEGQPQKTLLRVSDIDSVVERARKQEMLQKSEEDLKQCLQKTGLSGIDLMTCASSRGLTE